MKVGIFSGTFDPVHDGHIALAKTAISQCGLDEVWFALERTPRHKQNVSNYDHRYQMLKLALKNNRKLTIHEPKQLAHSEITLLDLIKDHPLHEFSLLLGADSAKYIDRWESYPVIKDKCSIISFGRGNDFADINFNYPASSKTIREQIANNKQPEYLDKKVLDYIYEHKLYQS